jgi:hypothetical protein
VGRSVQTVSGTATGSGRILSASVQQPMSMELRGLVATRTPDALGRGATLGSSLVRVERIPARPLDLYALEGCVSLTATGLAGELCSAAGSSALRVELDRDINGSFETSATMDRYTGIGFRI